MARTLGKPRRADRAISPVIATLLLMIIAVASGVILYSYVMGWIGGATTGTSGQRGELSQDTARGDDSSNNIVAYVRNIGSVDVSINSAYEDGTSRSFSVSPAGSVSPGEVVTVTMTGCTTSAGYSAEVKLVCVDGTTLVFPVTFRP